MTIELSDIMNSLVEKSKDVSKEDVRILEVSLANCNTWIESLHYFAETLSWDGSDFFNNLSDEIFLDLHTSITLAHGGRLKAAGQILRSTLETSVFALYFGHHPIEAQRWSCTRDPDSYDMSFKDTLCQLCSRTYIEAASGRACDIGELDQIYNSLSTIYRKLSERVHGKYAYLQMVSDVSFSDIPTFCQYIDDVMQTLVTLLGQLIERPEELKKDVPATGEII